MPARTNPLVIVPRNPQLRRAILNDSGRLGLAEENSAANNVVVVSLTLRSVWKSVYVSSIQPDVVDIIANFIRSVIDVRTLRTSDSFTVFSVVLVVNSLERTMVCKVSSAFVASELNR